MRAHPRVVGVLTVAAVMFTVYCSESPPTSPRTSDSPNDASALQPAGKGSTYAPGQLLVKFKSGTDDEKVAKEYKATVGKRFLNRKISLFKVKVGDEMKVVRSLRRRSDVLYAEPDHMRTIDVPFCPGCSLPSDALFGQKWDLDNDGTVESGGVILANTGSADADIDWLEAFDHLGPAFDGAAKIAIIDTGARTSHQDLAGRIAGQFDFINNDGDASDDQGHGTHVAGTAGARGDNGSGVAGVAYGPNIEFLIAKVCRPTFFGLSAECPSSAIIAGIEWAVANGADVINVSLGGAEASAGEQEAFQLARNSGVLPFCAAGNNAQASVLFPAAFPECVAVSSTDWGDGLASYSNTGPEVQISAPGGDFENGAGYSQILSTCFSSDTDYCYKAGTSMATPQAAGLGALLYALGLTDPNEVIERMESTADDLGAPGKDTQFGHGRINAFQAVVDLSSGDPNEPPTAAFSANCNGLDCAFTDQSTDSDGSIVSWSWTFGDGATATTQNANHSYSCSGDYTVTLSVTDDGGRSSSASQTVSVSMAPAGGTEGPGAIPGLAMWLQADELSGVNDGDAVATWPDMSGSCNPATQGTASKRPTYRVGQVNGLPALVFDATDDGMSTPVDPGTATTIVTVYASRAAASGKTVSGGFSFFMGPYVGFYRNFNGSYVTGPSVGAGRWVIHTYRQSSSGADLFIDGGFVGSTSNTVNPTALVLGNHGTYSQVLDGSIAEVLVYTRALGDSEMASVHDWLDAKYVPPPGANIPPAAAFSADCTDLDCAFTDQSTDEDGTIVSWSWDFGDGGTSTDQNPAHSYAAEGTYTVSLTVTDDRGDEATASQDIEVTEAPVGGPFEDPSSVPDLILWLDAEELSALSDGDPVASWPDRVAGGSGASQSSASKRPLYRVDQVNGMAAVVFDASDDGLATGANPGSATTILIVYASRAGSSGKAITGGFSFFMGPYVGQYRNYNGAYVNGGGITSGRWLIQTFRQSSSGAEMFLDGVGKGSTTRVTNPATIVLGAQGLYSQRLDGSVAAVLVYNRALDDTELGNVHTWLGERYAIP